MEGELPEYCCAILAAPDGSLLMEERLRDAARAAGRLTCFGGRREEGESPLECIRRELREELGWCPQELSRAVTLILEGRPLAWFFAGLGPGLDTPLRTEPGHRAVWISPVDLGEAPVSQWHRAAIAAWLGGENVAHAEP